MLAEVSANSLFALIDRQEAAYEARLSRTEALADEFIARFHAGDGVHGMEANAVENELFNSSVDNCETVQILEFTIETAETDEQLIAAARRLRAFRQTITRRAAESWARDQA